MAFFKLSDLSEKEKKKYLQSIEDQVNERLNSRNSLEKEANDNFNNIFNSRYGQNNNINVGNTNDWATSKIKEKNSADNLLAPVETKINEDLYKNDLKNSAQQYYDNSNISYKNKNIFEDILGIGENLVRGASSGLKQTMNYATAVNKGYKGYNDITNKLARAKYLSTPIDQRNEDDLKKNFIEEAVNNSIAKDNEAISKNINAMSNKTTKKLAELAPSIGQMGTGTVIGSVNPILGGEYFFTSAAGSYLDDAKQRGMNDKQSIMYSTVMGGLEAITEEVGLRNFQKAGGAIKALASGTGKEGVKKAIQKVASKEIETSVKDVLKNYGIGIADNFVQEAIMDPLQEISATAIAGKNKADWSNMGQKMIQDGINGGLVAAIVGGANLGVNSCIGIVEKSSNGQTITQAEYNQALQDAQKAGVDVQQNIKEKIGEQINNINSNENIAPIQNSNNIQMEQNIERPKQVIKDFNESARQYNIDYSNEDLKEINQMYNKRGIKAYFDENTFKNNNDAFSVWKPVIDEQGNISSREVVINPNAQDTKTRVQELAIHELGHDLDLNEVQDMILKDASRKENWKSARKSLEDTYREAYKNDGINISEEEFNKIVDEEATMSILQRELGSQEYVNRLVNQNQSIAKKIYNWVIDKLNKFTGGKNEKIFWADVKNKFETAYNQEFNKNDNTTKFSIAGIKSLDNIKNDSYSYNRGVNSYNNAINLAKQNIDNEQIRQKTGWFQDKNGDWKYEFSDKDMALKNVKIQKNKIYKLVDILKHDTLFTLYPETRDYKVEVSDKIKGNASFDRKNNTITVSSRLIKNNKSLEGTLIHEIQHAIQNIEKFERGTSTKGSKLKYYNSLGEIEAAETKERFLAEKYQNKDMSKIAPESSKANPQHKNLNEYLKNRNLLDKVKDSMYNYFNKKGGNNYEVSEEIVEKSTTQNNSLVDERKRIESENNSGSFSFDKTAKRYEDLLLSDTLSYNKRDNGTLNIEMYKGKELINQITVNSKEEAIKQLGNDISNYIYENAIQSTKTLDLEQQDRNYYKPITHKEKQLDIIKKTNPMLDDYHTGIRKLEDIKTFEEAIQDEDSFSWGDYSKEDAEKDLKRNKVRIYSSYAIKNGTFVSTSYQQALDYAGGDISKVHSKEVLTDEVAWINGDEGQYANTNQKYALPTKEWQQFLEDNYQKQGTGKNLKEYNLPTMQDVKSSNVEQKNQNVKIPMKSDIEKENFNSNMDKYNFYKSRKIKANEEAINSLISYKNESIRSIENKIAEKENALKNLKNSDTKVAANIRNQIENLKVRKSKIENDYNLKIDKFNQKNTKEKLDVETQNEMKKDARETLSEEIKPLLNGIENWKDKDLLGGFRYNRETAQRNTYDVVKDKSQAATINATIFDPIQVHQAEKTRETNKIFNEINNLKLDKTKKYDYVPENDIKPIKIDEATLAQLYIEKEINDTDLKKYNVDVNRIKTISKTFTNILDNLYNQMNETLVEYGYAPIKKIENYFPHFTENKADSTLGKIASYFGIEINNQELPTEIAGKTDTFKPGKTWNANLLKRNTNKTDYDALKILERYVNGAEDIIHTTGDIQRVREFSKQIRYNFSDDGVKERIDNINNNEDLMQFEKEEAIDAIFSQEKNQLSHYVTWLDDYANTLANKKSFSDRNIEREVGRNIYTNMANIESRIAANTIGGNLSVSLTNFAPIFQSMGSTKPINVFMGMIETTKNNILGLIKGEKDTSFVQNSNFLTNRFGTDTISAKTTTQNISDIFSKLMNKIDEFSSESIVRAKYRENLQNGLSEYEALDKADKDTAKIMADRSKGALPIFFNKKNPISKLMTMFQVEPNNIISNYFKDMPQDAETKQQLAYNYGKLMVASYAFNTIIMAVRGGNEVLPDPIRIVSYMIKWLTGDDDDEKEKAKNDLTEALISSVPFVQNAAGLLGYEDIGRIPISNAMPDLAKISSLMDKDVDSNYKKETSIKEISKPLLYLGLPVGGAQINKTIQGIETLKAGGSYTTNKKGERLLQFPVENANILDYGKAVVFGKWSLPEAQNYSKSLNAKQTKIYEESNIPYKELLDFIDKGMTKKEDKLNYLNSTDLATEQKWGIYKYDILSNTTRADGSSQLQDAEYIIENGVSKEQFINIYNKAQKNNIDIPTQKEYKQMKKSNISLNNYIDYKIKEKDETKKQRDNGTLSKNQSLSNVDKIDILLNSRYSDKEKRGIYENYIKSEKDTEYKIMSYTNVDIDEYLKYKQQEFESDYEDDGTTTGKAISNSKQKKVYEYVNSSGMNYEQRLLLLGMKYKLNVQERTTLANYVNNLDITSVEKIEIYEKLKGFTVYKNGNVNW